jgi:hypothetical protein
MAANPTRLGVVIHRSATFSTPVRHVPFSGHGQVVAGWSQVYALAMRLYRACESADVISLLEQRAPQPLQETEIVAQLGLDRVETRVVLRRLWRARLLRCSAPGFWALAGPLHHQAERRAG